MIKNNKLPQLKGRKSVLVLKKVIPLLLIGGVFEFVLLIHHSSLTKGTKYIFLDILYSLGVPILFIFVVLALCSIIALAVDISELWVTGKLS